MITKKISLIALIIATAITVLCIYIWNATLAFSTEPSTLDWNVSLPNNDTSFGNLFTYTDINDSLPYREYKKKEDSLNTIKKSNEADDEGIRVTGMSTGCIGLYSIPKEYNLKFYLSTLHHDAKLKIYTDSLDKLYNIISQESATINQEKLDGINKIINERNHYLNDSLTAEQVKEKNYYFGLNGYSLKDFNTKFFIKNEKINLAFVKWDSTIKRKYDSTKKGHYEHKQIGVRFAIDRKQLLIPISKSNYDILKAGFYSLLILNIFLSIYFFIGSPIQILINISRGRAFTDKNINLLSGITIVTFIYASINIFAPHIFRLLFWKKIPQDFQLAPFFNNLMENLWPFFICIILFFITKAFKRGYKLQEEQALTI